MLKNPAEKAVWDSYVPKSGDNAYLGVVVGDIFVDLGKGPCHGGFQTYSVSGVMRMHPKLELKEAWSKRMMLQDEADEELAEVYYTWLINDSPFKEAFIEKDYKVCKEKGFNLRVDLPSDYVAAAAIATRFLTERHGGEAAWVKKRIPLYKRLIEDKMDPLWAFLLANMYAPNSKGYSYQMIDGHEMLPSSLSIEGLKRFVNGDYCKTTKTFAENKGYISVGSTWTSGGSGKSHYLSTVAKTISFEKKEYKDLNVFRKPDLKSGYPIIPYEDLPKVVEKLKELMNA